MMKRSVQGSYTVEAALLFPIILGVVVSLIYLGFYMHDKNKIEGAIDLSLLKGKNLVLNDASPETGLINYETYRNQGILGQFKDFDMEENELNDYVSSRLSDGLFLSKIKLINVSISNENIVIEITSSLNIPFWDIGTYLFQSGKTILYKKELKIENTKEFIRIIHVFGGVAEKIPLIDETLQSLHKILDKIR